MTSPRPRLLLVDDNEDFLATTAEALERDFEVELARNAGEAFHRIEEAPPELILLDAVLGSDSGHRVCRELRESPATKNIPVIMISGDPSSRMEVDAFEAGASDFVEKPFTLPALRARILARWRAAQRGEAPVLRLGDLELDASSGIAKLNGRVVPLSPMEFQILLKLLESRDRPLSREEICDARGIRRRNVDAHMVKIRRKLKNSSLQIHSIYGKGYLLASGQ
ncbi:MAG: response regulator transcription factor [Bdellovibrionales bacterium]|nr:response regulator transcription factor [Bdellovibrionales bacterium]